MKSCACVTIFCLSGLLSAVAAPATTNVNETWEGNAFQSPFTNSVNATWYGDTGTFQITNSTWPVLTTDDFSGTHSLRSLASVNAFTNALVTSFSFNSSYTNTWSVYVGGNSADIVATRGFFLVLLSDTSDVSLIKSGIMSGYRLQFFSRTGTTDSLVLQKATGSGWSNLSFLDFSSVSSDANVNYGWNLAANRTPNGVWTLGFTTGVIGSAVALVSATNDTSILSGAYTGMGWFSSTTAPANAFGFDNFLIVTSVPEPSTWVFLSVALIGAALCGCRKEGFR